ncbi:MAG: AraC family transcriptional regulator [Bacteroidales bacterium]|nr:AraC family transcriptional regulator [Bacteroidales bacterium]
MKHQRQLEDSPLKLNQIAAIRGVSDEYSHLGQDYILSHITSDTGYFYTDKARRIDGHTMIICVKGHMKVTIDLDTVDVPPGSLVFVAPERVFKPTSWEGTERDAYLLFLSNKFVYDLNIDLNAVNTNIFTSAKSLLTLPQEKLDLIIRYFEMLHANALSDTHYNRHIARALTSAAAYQIMAFGEEMIPDVKSAHAHNRKLTYVKNFLRLVRANHRRERAIGFYADKMFISPKYLSLIIKEATGRSAAEWIDQYVIQEAKNQLRYSGKNVQQIAYDLNFSNQSSFGKYFKNLTGLSPTQFQNQ